ncbi:response regulator transcription factor [Streptomyces sp. NBC_01240]|uniref:response regulator transcription factor n=1 Tax=Streptomyces sp. NBC_01240 TaxID=2903793 RepID=UPI002E117B3F|nr:LuxR C-terminal-related transcriptional regulator [Streptomyces sp. NBC_01240]
MRATRFGLPLTDREVQILQAFSDGASYGQIAADLFLAKPSVRNYASSAMKKLGASNQSHAVRIAFSQGLLRTMPAVDLPVPWVQVLELVAAGRTNKEISEALERSEHTVVAQIGAARKRLGARDRAHAAALAVALQLVRVDVTPEVRAESHAA